MPQGGEWGSLTGAGPLLDPTSLCLQALGIYTTLTKQQAVKMQDETPSTREDPQPPPTEVLKSEEASSS